MPNLFLCSELQTAFDQALEQLQTTWPASPLMCTNLKTLSDMMEQPRSHTSMFYGGNGTTIPEQVNSSTISSILGNLEVRFSSRPIYEHVHILLNL